MSLAELKYVYGIDEDYEPLYVQAEAAMSERELDDLREAMLSIDDNFKKVCDNFCKCIRMFEMYGARFKNIGFERERVANDRKLKMFREYIDINMKGRYKTKVVTKSFRITKDDEGKLLIKNR